ncbi:carboxypeptidase regulatory-like domain-containing protein [Rubrivirga litoralis]|uniref:Carboxypeptidase regulatory-like domain-containing protein n=1 Tax=Rubrivirga litoralis TaxID=3075598 RepID=A0ABU3BN64_9BACT|nr:carboxypeptidase regulatory-like domain-containing protein [Rubrivirga sp. F394]MDT0630666.1 carboxypeptidase regulatory-like domain-containing protein [Rubrivirga sp. F394]
MRLLPPAPLLVGAALALAACGTVVPYSLAPEWLAPDLVPPTEASAVVVTGDEAAALSGRTALDGRVLDETTGRPVAGVAIAGGRGGAAVTDADGRFTLDVDAGGVALVAERAGYAPAEAALQVAPDTRAGVLILLSPRLTPNGRGG